MAKMRGAEALPPRLKNLRHHLDLFPESRQTVSTRGGLVAALAVAVGVVVTLLRLSGPAPTRTLYGEDGKIFLSESVLKSGIGAWTSGYNGYIHVVPRGVAALAAPFGLDAAPAVFAITSAIVLSLLALLVFWASDAYIRSTPVRVLLAVSLVALPVGQSEVYANSANLHWYFVFASFWVLLWNPARNWELAVGCVVVLLAGLSDPLTVLLLPIVLLRLVVLSRRGRGQLPSLAFAVGLAIQFLGMMLTQTDRPFAEYANPLKLPFWFLFHVGGRSALGSRVLDDQTAATLAVSVVIVVAMAVVVWFGVRPISSGRAQVALLAIVSAGAFYALSVFLTGLAAPRYEALPVLLVYSAVALGVDGILQGVRSTPVRALAAVLVVVVMAGWVVGLRFSSSRSVGPTWHTALERAADACRASGDRLTRIEIVPHDGFWTVVLPCSRVIDAASGS